MKSERPQYRSRPGLLGFYIDLIQGLRLFDLWRTFAFDEIQQRYRRSRVGFIWIIISYAIFVGGVSIIFSAFSIYDGLDFIIHVAISYAAFNFIIGNITDGCESFTGSRVWIHSISMPHSIHVYRSVCRAIFIFSLQLSVAAVLIGLGGWRPTATSALIIPAIIVFLANAIAIQFLMGVINARYRDVTHLVSSITRLLLFVTPILWTRDDVTGIRGAIADLNPVAHYVDIFTAPILGEFPRTLSWTVVITTTIILWVAVSYVGARFRHRIAYWL
jgi:ABC-type polysaccharide/polyol phosphate export permease